MLLVVDAEVIFTCLIKRESSLGLIKIAKEAGIDWLLLNMYLRK